jgi:hypothetical protein
MTRYFLALIAALATTDARVDATELIENGSFEADPDDFGSLRTGWDDGPGVGNDIGFGIHDYPSVSDGEEGGTSAPGGFELPPGATDPTFSGIVRPVNAGRFYGAGWGAWNGSGFEGSATQIVELTEHAGRPYEFSAWLASRAGDTDYPIVTLEFFDDLNASGELLGSIVFDGNDQTSTDIVGSLDLEGFADPSITATQDNWTLYRSNGRIPLTAGSAAVIVQSATVTGVNGNDAFVDLVSLQVVPEPATTGLLVAGILACAGMLRRWK